MDPTDVLILSIAAAAMFACVLLTFIPLIPGTVMVWLIGVIAAFANQFQQVTIAAAITMTLIVLISATRDFWLPVFGMRTSGLSCLTSLGAMIGGICGTLFIPVPILGTLIGTIIGAFIVEFIAARRVSRGFKAGTVAFKLFIISYVIEIISAWSIFVVFLISIATMT
jgi:hypothetical protein